MQQQVEFKLTLDDFRAYAEYLKTRHVRSRRGKWETIACWIMGIVATTILVTMYYFFMSIENFELPCFFSMSLVFLITYIVWNRRTFIRRFVEKETRSPSAKHLLDTQTVVITSEGLQQTGSFGEVSLKWSTFTEIQVAEKATYFHISANSAIIVPRHAFSNEQECLIFIQKAQRYYDPSDNIMLPCAKCGYDLRSLEEPGCPECGWRREE